MQESLVMALFMVLLLLTASKVEEALVMVCSMALLPVLRPEEEALAKRDCFMALKATVIIFSRETPPSLVLARQTTSEMVWLDST